MLCDGLDEKDGTGVRGKSTGEGIYIYIQLIHFIVQQKLTHCKAIIFQLKILSFLFFSNHLKMWKPILFCRLCRNRRWARFGSCLSIESQWQKPLLDSKFTRWELCAPIESLVRYTVVVNKENNMDVYPCSTYTVKQKKLQSKTCIISPSFDLKKYFSIIDLCIYVSMTV